MSYWLYEYDTGRKYGPASDKHLEKYRAALEKGRPFFLYPAYGYEFRMTVKEEAPEGSEPSRASTQ